MSKAPAPASRRDKFPAVLPFARPEYLPTIIGATFRLPGLPPLRVDVRVWNGEQPEGEVVFQVESCWPGSFFNLTLTNIDSDQSDIPRDW